MKLKTAAIMQPTYLPWMGYFDLMDQSDVFVILDSVQFEKRSWQQRNRIKTPQGELMLSIPVLSKGRFDQDIREVEIDTTKNFQEGHLKAIKYNYAKAKYFNQYIVGLEDILLKEYKFLADFNTEMIVWLKSSLKIPSALLRSSDLDVTGKKAGLLVSICKNLGARRYISPQGAKAYIEGTDIFQANDIELCYQEFKHPPYTQLFGDFIPYLSVVDLLFNEGEKGLDIIRSGRKAHGN